MTDAKVRIESPQSSQGTAYKKEQFYSAYDHGDTLRKQLYPDFVKQEDVVGKGRSHQLEEMESSINNYKPTFQLNTAPPRSTQYKTLELNFDESHPAKREQPTHLLDLSPVKTVQKRIKEEELMQRVKVQLEDLPQRRTSRVDREITALYKENRNVNLEYRREQFMKIFLGK